MPTANPTALSYYGIAKEGTKGVYAAPTDYLPLTKFDPVDKTHWLNDDGMRGSMAKDYNKIAGPVWSEISCSGPVFPDTFGFPIMSLLGDVTVTGGSAPFQHVGSLKNNSDGQPVSSSLTDYDSVETRGYAGCQWYSVDLKWDGEKLLTWDGTAKGYQSANQSKPTASFSAITAVPGWTSTVTVNSVSTLTLVGGELKFKRDGGPINTGDGTQAPYQIFVGDLAVSGKLTLIADTATQRTNYLAGTKIPVDFQFQQGAGPALTLVQIHATNCNMDEVKTQRGKRYVEYEVDLDALPNSTDVGATGGLGHCRVTLKNAKPSGTFA